MVGCDIPDAVWPELAIARLTYPQLPDSAQGTWLGLEPVSYYPGFLHGYFTFRAESNKFGPNLQDYIEKGRSHILCPMVLREGQNGKDKVVSLFLVDIRKAVMRLDLATLRTNRHREEYYLFDSLTPGVDRFAERLRVS
jgi:hypothetical protein